MRNLLVVSDVATTIELNDGELIEQLCFGDDKLYVATSEARVLCIAQDNVQVIWRRSLSHAVSAAKGHANGTAVFAALAYVLELDAVCAALCDGTLLLLRGDSSDIEEVGAFNGGIAALQWSPAGDVVAVADSNGRLLLLSQGWEPLSEVSVPGMAPSAGSSDPAVMSGQRANVRLTWRGDGKYLASISCAGGVSAYSVHVWDREGCALHATAEPMAGLLPTIAWQPNGRHLYVAAMSQQEPLQQRVALYERNGLQHGDFEVASTSGRIVQLSWSIDSELLAVVLAPPPPSPPVGGEPQQWNLQVWHRSNWHWYLKQTRAWPAARAPLLVQWDDAVAGRLHCLLAASGGYERLEFGWDSCTSGFGTAAVIQGADVLLTPLRHSVVPPPMCSARARFAEPLTHVAFGTFDVKHGNGAGAGSAAAVETLAGLTGSGRLGFLRAVEEDLWEETVTEQHEDALAAAPSSGTPAAPPKSLQSQDHLSAAMADTPLPLGAGRRLRALCWTGPASLVALAAPYPEPGMEDGQGDLLIEVTVHWADAAEAGTLLDGASVEEGAAVYAGGRVLRVEACHGGGAVVQLDTGRLLHYRPGAGLAPYPCAAADFPAPCATMRVTPAVNALVAAAVDRATLTAATPPAAGLSARGDLFWGSITVAAEVTSLAVRLDGAGGPALLYTTRKSLMYVVLLADLASYTHDDRLAANQQQEGPRYRHGSASYRMSRPTGAHYDAMHAAMRPHAATAAARDVMVRAVEEGSQLIAAPAGGIEVVLQMPRGNLETVRPRVLVLAATAAALRRCDYGAAWLLATVNRLDLNVVVDFRWPHFLSSADQFVAAVPAAADICDLLFALRPESVVAGGSLYSLLAESENSSSQGCLAVSGCDAAGEVTALLAAGSGSAAAADMGKVNAVCTAVREAVEALLPRNPAYLNVIVTSYSRSQPRQLEEALRCIRNAKEAELNASAAHAATGGGASCQAPSAALPAAPVAANPSTSVEWAGSGASPCVQTGGGSANVAMGGAAAAGDGAAERALRHLLLTVDADLLYRVALGMYDLPLAYMVVANAQRDPGECMLELQTLAAVPNDNVRQYRIDMQLQRHESALRNLVAAGPEHFDQALALARERGLLRHLLALVQADDARRPVVLEACGAALFASGKLEDAAVAYTAAGCHERAMHAYRAAGQWQMVLTVSGRQGWDGPAIRRLAAELAEELQVGGQLPAAAAVLEQYLGDADNAVTLLSDARHWREALRVAYKHARGDLVDTVVAPAAAESAAMLLASSRESVERITKYLERLRAVRQRRLDMQAALVAAGEEGDVARQDDADVQSNASTVGGLSEYTDHTHAAGTHGATTSRGSSQGPASTQGGRRAQRFTGNKKKDAKQKIRQGSPQEESALVAHLLGLAPAPTLLQEAAQLLELLVLLGHLADARVLQQQLSAWSLAHQAAKQVVRQHLAAAANSGMPVSGVGAEEREAAGRVCPPAAEVEWKWDILRAAA